MGQSLYTRRARIFTYFDLHHSREGTTVVVTRSVLQTEDPNGPFHGLSIRCLLFNCDDPMFDAGFLQVMDSICDIHLTLNTNLIVLPLLQKIVSSLEMKTIIA